jgi:hypothetical protein
MASRFTLFPQLIPELRLLVWQLALPKLGGKLLYPYQKGCWVFEEMGLAPDPNGEDLYFRFDTSRFEPLHIALPLYYVNQEARDVTLKWLQEHRLTVSRTSSSVYDALRPFDPRHDTVFVPSTQLEDFVAEPAVSPHELGDMVERYFGTSNPALPRLAVAPAGPQLLKGELLSDFFQFGGTIETIFVVENASVGSLEALESVGGGVPVELAGQPVARVKWSPLSGLGEVSGDGERARARLSEYVEGFHIQGHHPSGFELEIQLVNVA